MICFKLIRKFKFQDLVFLIFLLVLQSRLAESNELASRSSSASLLEITCLSQDGEIGDRKVSSLLQCQHFCTATVECNAFASKDTSGGRACKIFANTQGSSNCLDESWQMYSLARKKPQEHNVDDSCKASDTTSFIFPTSSQLNYAKMKTQTGPDFSSFTISFWVKLVARGYSYSVIYMYQGRNSGLCEDVVIKKNTIGFSLKIKDKEVNFFQSVPFNYFTHVAFIWSSFEIRLYLNGSISKTHTLKNAIGSIKGQGTAYLGRAMTKDTTGSCVVRGELTFKGQLSRVNMWKRVLSPTEISAAMQSQTATNDLVVRWGDLSGNCHGKVKSVPFK